MSRSWMVACGLALACACACRRPSAMPPPTPPPENSVYVTPEQLVRSSITVETVGEGVVSDRIYVNAKIAFDDTSVQHVVSPISGRVVEIGAALGEHVEKGQALATIESPDLGGSSSDVKKARAEVVAARESYRRQKILFDNQASSQLDLESATSTYRKARAELARAEEHFRLLHPRDARASGVTQRFTLRAALDGEVLNRTVTRGAELQSQYTVGGATELFTIGTIDKVWALGDLFEVDLPKVKLGARAEVRVVSYPDRVFPGTIDWVQGMLEPQQRTSKIRVTLDNRDRALRPEMYATIEVLTPPVIGLAVPRRAVLRVGDQTVVFVQRETRADGRIRFERHPVSVDEGQPRGVVAVKRGLERGERIATANVQILANML